MDPDEYHKYKVNEVKQDERENMYISEEQLGVSVLYELVESTTFFRVYSLACLLHLLILFTHRTPHHTYCISLMHLRLLRACPNRTECLSERQPRGMKSRPKGTRPSVRKQSSGLSLFHLAHVRFAAAVSADRALIGGLHGRRASSSLFLTLTPLRIS